MDCKIIPALQEDLDKALEQAYYRTKEPKTCIICGSKFYQGRSSVNVCGQCYIDFTCPQCGKEHCRIKLDYRGRIRSIKKFILAGGDIKDYEIYCSNLCANRHNADLGRTPEACEQRLNTMKNNGTYEKWQKSCHSKESRILAYSSMIKNGKVKNLIEGSNRPEVLKRKQEARIASGGFDRFMKAGHKRTSELWADKGEDGRRYRKLQKAFLESHKIDLYPGECVCCKTFCEHRTPKGIGVECGCYSNTWGCRPNFITEDNILYYKDHPFAEIRDGLLSGELDIADYPGFAIKFDTVTYHNIDPMTNEKILFSGKNFELRDGIEYVFDRITDKYVLWEKYKSDFQTDKINNNVMHKIEEEFNNLGGLYLQTFISKDSPLNCGHALFDKLLTENNINWFAYIKFIKNTQTGDILPAVAGKSGSLNVNSSGGDLSFSLDPKHGPTRKLINESCGTIDWVYNQVYVIPCDSEE